MTQRDGGRRLSLIALEGIPLIGPGDDLVEILLAAVGRSQLELASRDVLVMAQKIVSKAEGRYRDLASVQPSSRALELAPQVDKDPRLVELVLAESSEVVRHRAGVLIVAHRLGFVLANAGVDHSNVGGGEERVLLLPEDPDASARRLCQRIRDLTGVDVGVLIIDSLGRAWRNGTVGTALGCCGVPALLDLRGQPDLFGRPLQVTEVGFADELAAAASLLMGQANEGTPVVLVRGLDWPASASTGTLAPLLRPKQLDLFR
jgi:coenzyme F420-0:L-glutamate ligase/coenzyme F420-1:gamma-L-glutamate ligase